MELQELGYRRELDIIKKVNHPLIIRYKDDFITHDNRLAIIMELASEGSLENFI